MRRDIESTVTTEREFRDLDGSPGRLWPRAVGLFLATAMAVSLLSGLPVLRSQHAGLVGGAHALPDPIEIPMAFAVVLLVIGGFGPAAAAALVTRLDVGRGGVRALFRQLLRWRVAPHWYLLALLGPSVASLLALAAQTVISGRIPDNWFRPPTPFAVAAVFFGPLGEEIGWRGFAQPFLQRRMGTLAASGVVAVLWFVWHQWPLLGSAAVDVDVVGLLVFFFYLLSASVLMAWLYNGTEGALPVAWVAHAGLNLNVVARGPLPFPYTVALLCGFAAIVALRALVTPRSRP